MVTTNDVRAAYRAILHITEAREPAYVLGLVPTALNKAIADVAAIFGGNGFEGGQITGWPGYDATVTLQSVFWVLSMGALLDTPENQRAMKELLKNLDQREELKLMYPDENGLPVILGKTLSEVGFGVSKIVKPDGKGWPGEPFRDHLTGGWRKI